ncbi:MAG: hypothetical protein V1909_02090 [Candidatus Micrarchaeota archaeon]
MPATDPGRVAGNRNEPLGNKLEPGNSVKETLSRAEAAVEFIKSKDKRTISLLFESLKSETNPKVAAVMLLAHQALSLRINGQVDLEQLKELLECSKNGDSRFENSRQNWNEEIYGCFNESVRSFDNLILESISTAFSKKDGDRGFENLLVLKEYAMKLLPKDPQKALCIELMGELKQYPGFAKIGLIEYQFREEAIVEIRNEEKALIGASSAAHDNLFNAFAKSDRKIPFADIRAECESEAGKILAEMVKRESGGNGKPEQ